MTNPHAEPAPKVLSATPRTRHRRLREQGRRERSELFAMLRAGLVAHLGVIVDGVPMVVPTGYGFDDEQVYVHGSVASRSLRAAKVSTPVCVTVTHIDGLVLARSLFEHSVNYRCAVVYGVPDFVGDAVEKLEGLRVISDQVAPGQWEYARPPSARELAATTVLRLALDEASVKIRSGPPDDGDGPDADLDLWAGEIPLRTVRLDPVADPTLRAGIRPPSHLSDGNPAPGSISRHDLS
jgi:nitroimidazol reductase NimA-like FMN-containing flavoprotein (pyridoxamine 5'-phosphate oxidase superfamily)